MHVDLVAGLGFATAFFRGEDFGLEVLHGVCQLSRYKLEQVLVAYLIVYDVGHCDGGESEEICNLHFEGAGTIYIGVWSVCSAKSIPMAVGVKMFRCGDFRQAQQVPHNISANEER